METQEGMQATAALETAAPPIDPVILQIKVKPNARESRLEPPAGAGGVWLAKLKSPPVDGRANRELVELLAAHFACAKSAVTVKSGASGRMKLIHIAGR